jgi:tetratricopeptide (TPR) repeat protein
VIRFVAAGLIFALLLLCGRAFAQPSNGTQMDAALRALSEERYSEARDLFAALVAADPRNPLALHGQGLALLQLGEPAKALPVLEKAATLGVPDRSLVINLASAQLKTRNTMRAVKLLRDHLAANPQPLDEPMLRALEAALLSADAGARKNRLWIDASNLAESYARQLEAARPGWKRWGNQWKPSDEVDALRSTNESAQQKVARIDSDMTSLRKTLVEMQQQLRELEYRHHHGFTSRWEIDAHLERMRAVEGQLKEQMEARKKLLATIVEPEFDVRIAPVMIGQPAPPIVPPEPDTSTPRSQPSDTTQPTSTTRPSDDDSDASISMDPSSVRPPTTTMAPPAGSPGADPSPMTTHRDAVAVTLTRDLVVVPLKSVKDATTIELQMPGNSRLAPASVVREDGESGLALLRVGRNVTLRAIPLADRTEPGETTYVGFSGADLFQAIPESVNAKLTWDDGTWKLDAANAPPLTGAALCRGGRLVGIVLREDGRERVIDVSAIRRLLAEDAALQPVDPVADPRTAVLHLSATHGK